MQREHQKKLALKKKELSDKHKIIETLNADIAVLQGKEPELLAEESTPSQGSESKKKRRRTQDQPEIDVDQLADAELSKLLPDGLVKQEGATIKVKCAEAECDCCDISKPFHHFALCIGKVHGANGECHMCSLYGQNDTFSSMAEQYLKRNNFKSTKKRRK